jgi:hypothetical protein
MVIQLADAEVAFDRLRPTMSQSTYNRRYPGDEFAAELNELLASVCIYLKSHDRDERAWRLHSEIAECLLLYDTAYESLMAAIGVAGNKSKRDLKKLHSLTAERDWWSTLGLLPRELADIKAFLNAIMASDGRMNEFAGLRRWAELNDKDPNVVIGNMQAVGGNSDWQVLANVV